MLTADQLMDFEEMISALIVQLQVENGSAAESTAAVSPDNAIGRISRMDSILSQEIAKSAMGRRLERISYLEGALLRLDNGSFGMCLKCGSDIETERLLTAPETVLCGGCAAKASPQS